MSKDSGAVAECLSTEVLDTKGGRLPRLDELLHYCRKRKAQVGPGTLAKVAESLPGFKGVRELLREEVAYIRCTFERGAVTYMLDIPAPTNVHTHETQLFSAAETPDLHASVELVGEFIDALTGVVPPRQLLEPAAK